MGVVVPGFVNREGGGERYRVSAKRKCIAQRVGRACYKSIHQGRDLYQLIARLLIAPSFLALSFFPLSFFPFGRGKSFARPPGTCAKLEGRLGGLERDERLFLLSPISPGR